MRPYGIKKKVRHKCVGHGSNCVICCPVTFKQARKRGLLDYSLAQCSRTYAKREAQQEIEEQLETGA